MQEGQKERMREGFNALVENGVITQKQADSRFAFMQDRMNNFDGKMGKFAVSVNAVKKTGDGIIDKTWTDAWAYYFGMSYEINDKRVRKWYT